jgi:Bax protein
VSEKQVNMRDRDLKTAILFFFLSCSFLVSINYLLHDNKIETVANKPGYDRVEIKSYEQLKIFYSRNQITLNEWRQNPQHINRIIFNDIPKAWSATIAPEIPVAEKKEIFFLFALPLVLTANESILSDRFKLQSLKSRKSLSDEDVAWITDLTIKYNIKGDIQSASVLEQLLNRVDMVPPSLAVAQMVEESGWGTSRFAYEGNALFGQWTYGAGIVPAAQRVEKGDYRIRKFDSLLQSVDAYMLNLNRNTAYSEFRLIRKQMRERREQLNGYVLAAGLISYSERKEEYISSLRNIIGHNNLSDFDSSKLISGPDKYLMISASDR